MRSFILVVVSLVFLSVYTISSSSRWMRKITNRRFSTESIFKSSRYFYGDLYGLSYFRDFKIELGKENQEVRHEACSKLRNIDLYYICDSYLYSFIKSDSIFCGVNSHFISRWDIDSPRKIILDTTKTNVLLIERAERILLYHSFTEYFERFIVTNKSAGKIDQSARSELLPVFSFINEKKIRAFGENLFNKNINQNLEFNLFDYIIFNPFKEFKAYLNYALFDRSCTEVATIPGNKYLFLRETIDPKSNISSFSPITDNRIQQMVDTLNLIDKFYRNAGFDFVCTSIIPNTVSIVRPGYGKYNDLIRRIQNNPDLQMPMVNIFDVFDSTKYQVYFNSDSHWNLNGFNLWVNEFNRHLRKIQDTEQKKL